MKLRDYQATAKDSVFKQWNKGRMRTLLVLATGTGKTVIFSHIAKDFASQGKKVLILAHRGELLQQAADKLMTATGLACAVEKAQSTSVDSFFAVTVGSIQTLMREKRLSQFSPDYFDAIIIDEAHHALSDSYQRVLTHFSSAKVLGVTATADRGDRKDLGQYFDSIAFEYGLAKAVKEGYLCPIKAQTIPINIDLSEVKQQSGDYSASDLGTALDPYLEQIADEMLAVGCMDRKTVIFLPLIATSQKFQDILQSRGFNALEVNGESENRKEVIETFDRAGAGSVLCNSMLLTEGWDCPSVDCIIILRATRARSLYVQMVGRGTRLSPETGKDHLLLLDFLWHTSKLELCRPASLIAKSDEVAKNMTKRIEEADGAVGLEDMEVLAEQDVVTQREEKLADELLALKKRRRKLVDPLQFEMSICDVDLSDYVPNFGWEMSSPTDRQLSAIENCGLDTETITCAGQANIILDKLSKRMDAGLSTPKQIRLLEQRGFKHVGTWQNSEASKIISTISANGWRIPNGLNPSSYQPESLRCQHA